MLKNGTIKCENGKLTYVDPSKQPPNRMCYKLCSSESQDHLTIFVALLLDAPYDDGIIASEYFYENTGSNLAVALLDTYVDFGSCSRYRMIDNQTIRITNNTKGKMSCVWHVPGETTG
jgi:hypothetical protein